MKKLTIPPLATAIMKLGYEEELLFKSKRDSDLWGAKRIRVFDGDIILFGYYGGFETDLYNPFNDDSDDNSGLIEMLRYHLNNKQDTVFLMEDKDMSFLVSGIPDTLIGNNAKQMLEYLTGDKGKKQNWQTSCNEEHRTKGMYFDKSRWIVFDNTSGNSNVEEFQYPCQAILWLKGELNSDSDIIGFSTLK